MSITRINGIKTNDFIRLPTDEKLAIIEKKFNESKPLLKQSLHGGEHCIRCIDSFGHYSFYYPQLIQTNFARTWNVLSNSFMPIHYLSKKAKHSREVISLANYFPELNTSDRSHEFTYNLTAFYFCDRSPLLEFAKHFKLYDINDSLFFFAVHHLIPHNCHCYNEENNNALNLQYLIDFDNARREIEKLPEDSKRFESCERVYKLYSHRYFDDKSIELHIEWSEAFHCKPALDIIKEHEQVHREIDGKTKKKEDCINVLSQTCKDSISLKHLVNDLNNHYSGGLRYKGFRIETNEYGIHTIITEYTRQLSHEDGIFISANKEKGIARNDYYNYYRERCKMPIALQEGEEPLDINHNRLFWFTRETRF